MRSRTSPSTRSALGDLGALFRELHAGARALDEGDAELVFELLDLHGERRLGDGALLRGAAKVQLTRQRIEVAQLLERDVRHYGS